MKIHLVIFALLFDYASSSFYFVFLPMKLLMLMVCGKNTCVIFGSWLRITAVHYLPVLPRKIRSGNTSMMSVKVLLKTEVQGGV